MTAPESTTSARRTETAERKRQAVALRIAGATFEQIGERLGISKQAAHGLVVKALEATNKQTAETAEQLRAIELQRLDALQAALWADAMRGDEQKVDRVLRVMQRRAALLGLDAPARQEIAQTIETVETYDYNIATARIAPRPSADSTPPGEGEGHLHGAALGQDLDGG